MRPSWDEYFMTITRQVSERSTCTRAKVGAIIVRDRNILATGYNGSPSGAPHCLDVGCLMFKTIDPDGTEDEYCFRTIHAEMNALTQAAKHGSTVRDADLYCTHSPCYHCFKVLMNTGLRRIFYVKPYRLESIAELRLVAPVELLPILV